MIIFFTDRNLLTKIYWQKNLSTWISFLCYFNVKGATRMISGEEGYSLILILILPSQININFWLILTSKQTSGSVFNIIALPILMALPNLIQRVMTSNSIYWTKQKYIILILNYILLLVTTFWLLTLPFGQ